MYSRYLQSGGVAARFDPLENTLSGHRERQQRERQPRPRYESPEAPPARRGAEAPPVPKSARMGGRLFGGDGGLGRLLKGFHIDLDSGDILLLIIMLLLYMDSEDDELLLVLALMLFMGE
jgi:hypothetical protein